MEKMFFKNSNNIFVQRAESKCTVDSTGRPSAVFKHITIIALPDNIMERVVLGRQECKRLGHEQVMLLEYNK